MELVERVVTNWVDRIVKMEVLIIVDNSEEVVVTYIVEAVAVVLT
jgi:hypothetical protein